MYWFLIDAGGNIVSALERELTNGKGYFFGTYTPERGADVPFRSILDAYRTLRHRKGSITSNEPGEWSIRRGLGFGYYAEWIADRTMPSGGAITLTYLIVPTPKYNEERSWSYEFERSEQFLQGNNPKR